MYMCIILLKMLQPVFFLGTIVLFSPSFIQTNLNFTDSHLEKTKDAQNSEFGADMDNI